MSRAWDDEGKSETEQTAFDKIHKAYTRAYNREKIK